MHGNGAPCIFGQRVLLPLCTAQAARIVLSGGTISWYPHCFNTEETLDYVDLIQA